MIKQNLMMVVLQPSQFISTQMMTMTFLAFQLVPQYLSLCFRNNSSIDMWGMGDSTMGYGNLGEKDKSENVLRLTYWEFFPRKALYFGKKRGEGKFSPDRLLPERGRIFIQKRRRENKNNSHQIDAQSYHADRLGHFCHHLQMIKSVNFCPITLCAMQPNVV